ncbi:MAG TPA: phosphotransferase [Alphaproteobacteria bacterium]|nr:phosphotransferase [Alphaproteobacteria bacterium]
MTDRALAIAGFLADAGWQAAEQVALRADFSPRRFARLTRGDGRRAVLMDADADQHTESFVAVAGLLRGLGIRAPEIYAADADAGAGLVLMEDFGDACMGKMLDAGADPAPLYRGAVDVLIRLHRDFPPQMAAGYDLPVYSGALFAAQAELFLDVYVPFARKRAATFEESEGFRAAWKEVLKGVEGWPQSLMLRDFMPDNMMLLSGGVPGLLDFQDAGLGPAPYDLASLCEMVRRDRGASMLDEMIDYYHAQIPAPLSKSDLRRACLILAAQRHTRILGIVANWVAKNGGGAKAGYLTRVRLYLEGLLQDEALRPVRLWMQRFDTPLRDTGT